MTCISDNDKSSEKDVKSKEKSEEVIDDRLYNTEDLQDLNAVREFLNEAEEIVTFIRYEGIFHKVKIIGLTNIRSFGYSKIFNRKNFVSSRRSISHVEFGDWRIPIWLWVVLGMAFLFPISMMLDPTTSSMAGGLLVLPIVTLIFCFYFRKVTYLGTAIGSHFFHIITRKRYLLPDAEIFLKYVHLNPYFGKPASEMYIIPNFFGRWTRRLILFIAILTLFSWLIISIYVSSLG